MYKLRTFFYYAGRGVYKHVPSPKGQVNGASASHGAPVRWREAQLVSEVFYVVSLSFCHLQPLKASRLRHFFSCDQTTEIHLCCMCREGRNDISCSLITFLSFPLACLCTGPLSPQMICQWHCHGNQHLEITLASYIGLQPILSETHRIIAMQRGTHPEWATLLKIWIRSTVRFPALSTVTWILNRPSRSRASWFNQQKLLTGSELVPTLHCDPNFGLTAKQNYLRQVSSPPIQTEYKCYSSCTFFFQLLPSEVTTVDHLPLSHPAISSLLWNMNPPSSLWLSPFPPACSKT